MCVFTAWEPEAMRAMHCSAAHQPLTTMPGAGPASRKALMMEILRPCCRQAFSASRHALLEPG
jgi:hypothetical protein